MNRECDKVKERISDLITGILSEAQQSAVQRHIDECSQCRRYAESLGAEDRMLTGLVAQLETDMTGREEQVINRINSVNRTSVMGPIWAAGSVLRASLTKRAAAAAVILVVALYFVITLTWISQIQEYIRLSEECIRVGM
jgi:predicted anti-sigma-YlaC factor YlaD